MRAARHLEIDVRRLEALHNLPAPVQRVARLCDGVRSVELLVATSELPESQTHRVLARLQKLGLVSVHRPPHARAPVRSAMPSPPTKPQESAKSAAQFSSDEEAFFDRSIDHLLDVLERPDLDEDA